MEKIVCEIIWRSMNWESDTDWFLSIFGSAVNSLPSRPAILNTEFSQVMIVLLRSSVSMVTSIPSASGRRRMISEKIFASSATLPASMIVPLHTVWIPNSASLPTSSIFPLDASTRIHSRIDIVVFDGTALDTILIALIRSVFLNCSFMRRPLFILINSFNC